MITEHDITTQVRRLLTVYGSSKSEAQLIEAWKWVFRDTDIGRGDLSGAVGEYARSSARYMPPPGMIRETALRLKYEDTRHEGRSGTRPARDLTRCEACGAVLRELGPDEQILHQWSEDEGRTVDVLLPARRPRFGILHDLSYPHAGLPVNYGFHPKAVPAHRRITTGDAA